MAVTFTWRGDFTSKEVNALHAEAFNTREYNESGWNSVQAAWLQDTMVAARMRHSGIGTGLVEQAKRGAREAGCEWLHVDFDDHLAPFYYGACGFTATSAGLFSL